MKKAKVLIVRTAGTNCDEETAVSFRTFGAYVDLVHIQKIVSGDVSIHDYHIFVIPGGFTYGDDIESGRVLANELRLFLSKDIAKFVKDKKLVLGICNGFQVLVKAGFLPSEDLKQTATLSNNDSGKFESRWTYLKVNESSVWTKGLGDQVYFPVAHAEGKFLMKSQAAIKNLHKSNQVAFTYTTASGNDPEYPDNPNGSVDHVAGVTDVTGRILGLMPHPERHFLFRHHPRWTRMVQNSPYGDGAKLFENGITYVTKTFCSE